MTQPAWRATLALLLVLGCDAPGDLDAGPGPVRDSGGRDAGSDAGPDAGPNNEAPTAAFVSARSEALVLALDASASVDGDGTLVAYAWDFGDGTTGTGVTTSHTYAAAGCYDVGLVVTDDDGATGEASGIIRVNAGVSADAGDLAITGVPAPGSVLARDVTTNAATVRIEATAPLLERERILLRVYVGETLEAEAEAELCGGLVELSAPLAATRAARRVEVVVAGLGEELLVAESDDVVAGDFLIVTGQSNAVSSHFDGNADENLGDFVRSFGTRSSGPLVSGGDDTWYRAVVGGGAGDIGQWPLRMAAQLSERFDVPIALLNGGHGGQPIGFFQRNDAAPEDLETNYGRLLRRARVSGALGNVRAILFYQGESDGGAAAVHRDGFLALHEDWREDFPEVAHYYVTQIRSGCGGDPIQTREAQRTLPLSAPMTSLMSTTALDGHDGCHYAYADGYRELGDRYANLLARDLFGADVVPDTEPVNVGTATLAGDTVTITTLGDASALVVDEGIEGFFQLTGGGRTVASVTASGADLVVELAGSGAPPTAIAYVGHIGAGPWITNAAGIGMLTFQLPL